MFRPFLFSTVEGQGAPQSSFVSIQRADSNPTLSASLLSYFQSNAQGHVGVLSHFRRQYEADDLAVRRAFAFIHRLAVDVHRGSDVGVPLEFLQHLHRSPVVEQGPKGVPAIAHS